MVAARNDIGTRSMSLGREAKGGQVLCFAVVAAFLSAVPAHGQSVLRGGVAVRQGYDSNINRAYQGRQTEWTSSVSPSVSITTTRSTDSFFVQYAPEVVYSHRTDTERIDHSLAARAEKMFAERLRGYLSDTYRRAEDPYDDQEAGIQLADQRGRNRYWINNGTLGGEYEFAQESFLGLSYQHQVLRNDGAGQDDFTKQTPQVSLSYRLSHQWQTKIDYAFTKGDFDISDDLKSNTIDWTLSFLQTPEASIFGHYGFSETDYDGLQTDFDRQNISLGYERTFSPTLAGSLEAGTAFLDRDGQAGSDSFFFRLSLDKKFRRGTLAFSSAGGMDEQQFDGNAGANLSRYWQAQARFDYKLGKDLAASGHCRYREDDYLDSAASTDKQNLQAEVALTYSFLRWYKASLKYAYTTQNADVITDQYNDNRVVVELSAAHDLLKW